MIPLDPVETRSFLEVSCILLLDSDECDQVLAMLDDDSWIGARVTEADQPYGVLRPEVRSVLSQRLPMRNDGFPHRQIARAIADANGQLWRYDLTGFHRSDTPSVLRYENDAQDHFRSHLDAGPFAPTRKLSFSVQLSPSSAYRGGDLILEGNLSTSSREQGMMTIFPSVSRHEVTPVYSGRRFAIVGWIHGSTLR